MDARRIIGVSAAMLLVLGACSTKTKTSGPSVSISSPENGTTIKGNTVSLVLTATGVDVVKADGNTTGKSGHYHVFIDRPPVDTGQVIPKEPGIVHSAVSPTLLTGLAIGPHTLVVVLGDGTHRRIGNTASTIHMNVDGPSIDASAPATARAGQPVAITVKVSGVTLVKADGAPAGSTGHLHALIDVDRPAAGQPIPKQAGIIHTTATTIEVPALTTGEHTIWIVLGDGNHVPYDPPVLDKVVVTVS